MAGVANGTIGSIMIQATNRDRSQWVTKVPVAMRETRAISAAIAQARPTLSQGLARKKTKKPGTEAGLGFADRKNLPVAVDSIQPRKLDLIPVVVRAHFDGMNHVVEIHVHVKRYGAEQGGTISVGDPS
jgi:hypothetical protein